LTENPVSDPITCGTFRRQLYHFQADELSEAERQLLSDHADACADCARRLEVEDVFLRALKTRLPREAAPAELVDRVGAALRAEASPQAPASWFRAPWLAAAAASILLTLLLLPGLLGVGGSGWRSLAGPVHVQRQVTVVDFDCDRAGRTMDQQRDCTHPHHLNALKVGPDRYWNVSLDHPVARALVVEQEMRGHLLQVEGELYAGIETLRLTDFTDLGIPEQSSDPAAATLVGHAVRLDL
jgi:anti-sigma factor (TIGR02949 family)